MAKLNRVCFVCGKKHSYCNSCYEDRNLETWHIMFDNENCKTIFDVINKHYYNHISTIDAILKLEGCDLKDLDTFDEDIKKSIIDLMKQKNDEIKTYEKPTEDPVVVSDNETNKIYASKKQK